MGHGKCSCRAGRGGAGEEPDRVGSGGRCLLVVRRKVPGTAEVGWLPIFSYLFFLSPFRVPQGRMETQACPAPLEPK